MIRNRISSELADLNNLKKTYPWIPNEHQIRPTIQLREEKRKYKQYILQKYESFRDFILDSMFDYSTITKNGRLYVPHTIRNEWSFCKSMFPYDLEPEVKHYVLWNPCYDYNAEFDDMKINQLIEDTLAQLVGSDEFDFAWYKNPKSGIPEVWNCQIFWVRL